MNIKKVISKAFRKNINKLVRFAQTNDVYEAIRKEKQKKKWKREYKDNVIKELNPNWRDLSEDLVK